MLAGRVKRSRASELKVMRSLTFETPFDRTLDKQIETRDMNGYEVQDGRT